MSHSDSPTPAQAAAPVDTGASVSTKAQPPSISAARDAADFVARIFAEMSAPDPEPALPVLAAEEDDETEAEEEAAPRLQPGERLPLLPERKVLILGLGASGLAMARWCARCGARVTVADTRAEPPQLRALQSALPQARFIAGALGAQLLAGQDWHAVYRSPGLSPHSIAALVTAASALGLRVEGELALFSMALAALRAAFGYAPALLAVSGTNGKTTVTALSAALLARSGKRVALAGNIGPTLLDTLAAQLDAGCLAEVWVLELSSFQLDGASGFEPSAATVLNLTQDHLDWHGDAQSYAAAKARIFGRSALMLLNREDAAVMQMLAAPAAETGVKPQKAPRREYLTFGGDVPKRPGDYGIEQVGGAPWLVRAVESDDLPQRTPRNASSQEPREPQAPQELHLQHLLPIDALRIRGRHNAVNALAALALAGATGCPIGPMLYGLRDYRGEPHRVESVASVAGVEYFDDSKGTNVGATVAALAGLGADRRLVAILGGDGKGQDFAPLAAPVARHARAVVLMGRDAPLIRAALQGAGVALFDAPTLPQAVALAARQAQPGDAVLLSPACASFDMFDDYAQRAQVFHEAVHALVQRAELPPEGLA